MGNSFASWALLAWPPIVLVLFRTLGPRAGSAIAILGGWLLLPRSQPHALFWALTVDKRHVAGLALLAAALIFDRRGLLKIRPRWPDLAIAGFVLMPLVGSAAHRFEGFGPSVDQSFLNLASWGLPYAAGRAYFGDPRGAGFLALAVATAGILYIPPCWFETIAGPGWYLSVIVYNLPFYEGVIGRLGGYRPEVFLTNGLELAFWMALSATMAAWLALEGPGRRPGRVPSWASWLGASALILTTIACRGVFGYGILGLGLIATLSSHLARSKIFLALLLLVPPAYMASRASGLWDGRALREAARLGGREGTITIRLEAEDQLVGQVLGRDPAFGFGGRAPYWESDSWWTSIFKGGGAAGLVAHYLAWLLPAALVIFGPARAFPARSTESGLALLVVLHAVDSLLNTAPAPTTPLIGGALVSLRYGVGAGPSRPVDRGGRPVPVGLAATLAVLVVVEAIGQLSRSPRPVEGPTPNPPNVSGPEGGSN